MWENTAEMCQNCSRRPPTRAVAIALSRALGGVTPPDRSEEPRGGDDPPMGRQGVDSRRARTISLVGPPFNTWMGPFILEIDVLVDGVCRTVRSPEFSREQPHVMLK